MSAAATALVLFATAAEGAWQGAASAADTCAPLPGWEQVMERKELRWIVLGELHGTVETPALLLDALCQTGAVRPVAVALEIPVTEQAGLDAYLASDGGSRARAAFLRQPSWQTPQKDGRTGTAQFALVERLRVLRQRGQLAKVFAFAPAFEMSDMLNPEAYERRMAETLSRGSPDGASVLVLVGNYHAMRKPAGGSGPLPMAAHLPQDQTLTLLVEGDGGAAWNCQADSCAVHPVTPPQGPRPRALELRPAWGGAFDGVLGVGGPFTPSMPQPAEPGSG